MNIWYNKNRNEKPQTWFASDIKKNTSTAKFTDVFFYWLFAFT